MTLDDFLNKYRFNPAMTLYIGIERECFLLGEDGNHIAEAPKVLSKLSAHNDTRFGYELSACQIETRTRPLDPRACVRSELEDIEQTLATAVCDCGLSHTYDEVAPETMPLDVYPDPTGRYQTIRKTLSRHALLAGCRIIGTHVHIGMPDHASALRVYNEVVAHTDFLACLGDGSDGRRLAIYRTMAPTAHPKPHASWNALYQSALSEGFAEDPRRCWWLIRPSVHGTIEFRMFGATASINSIVAWAETCRTLCANAL